MSDLAEVGDFCPNDSCPDARKTDSGNIIKYGRTAKGLQRYRCKTCGKTFSENTGTIFYGLAHSGQGDYPKEIIETLALVVEGSRVSNLSRVKGYKEETIRNWLQQAAEHVERVEDVLMQEYEIDRGQLDGLWSYGALVLRRAQGPRRAGKGGGKKNRLTTRRGPIGVRQWSKQINGRNRYAAPRWTRHWQDLWRWHRKRFSGR